VLPLIQSHGRANAVCLKLCSNDMTMSLCRRQYDFFRSFVLPF